MNVKDSVVGRVGGTRGDAVQPLGAAGMEAVIVVIIVVVVIVNIVVVVSIKNLRREVQYSLDKLQVVVFGFEMDPLGE